MGSPLVFTGLLFTLSGFFFKLALFPFHIWAPGVYQGAANQVTAFMATSTKVAAIALILRAGIDQRRGYPTGSSPGGAGHRLHDLGQPGRPWFKRT